MKPLLLSKKAAIIAVVASLPFIMAGSYFGFLAYNETRWPVDAIIYWGIAQAIFLLGSPLTVIYMFSLPYIGKFLRYTIGNELAFLLVPGFVVLFIIQWVIWSQLLVFFVRYFRKLR